MQQLALGRARKLNNEYLAAGGWAADDLLPPQLSTRDDKSAFSLSLGAITLNIHTF